MSNNLSFYISVLATIVSIVGLTHFVVSGHDKTTPRTLSELAAAQDHLLRRFRNILFFCGTLFSIVVYGYLVPQSDHPTLLLVSWTLVYVGDLLAGAIPAKGSSQKVHQISAQLMALGMIATAFVLWLDTGVGIELVTGCLMLGLALATIIDPRRFVFYELPFLYLSHFSIVIAVLSMSGM